MITKICLFMLLLLPLVARAQLEALPLPEPEVDDRPLWEVGLGGGGTYTPDYPGSDQSHFWGIPFPYAIYRGEFLHSDRRGGTRARFIKSVGYELNISAAGGLPSSSGHNFARQGMPDLEWLGEAGPRLMVDLATLKAGRLLRFGLPLRAAFSANGSHIIDRGFVIAPELLYDYPNAFGYKLDLFTLLTVNFASKRFHDYFYEVKREYATVERPAYHARSGYLLSDLNVGASFWIRPGLKLSLGSSMEFLDGSVNQSSPLFRTPFDISTSLVLIWVFAESKLKVTPED